MRKLPPEPAPPLIITAGARYNDIDVYACALAYQQLCRLQGQPSEVVLPGPHNSSISRGVLAWGGDIQTRLCHPAAQCQFVAVDISDPAHLADFVLPERLIALYDHRPGFETYWQQRLGAASRIESVGACATLIWEAFRAAGLAEQIDVRSARLLYTAILSNTLALRAQATTERDRLAWQQLAPLAALPPDWDACYFNEVSQEILKAPDHALRHDHKCIRLGSEEYHVTQVELWAARPFIDRHASLIEAHLQASGHPQTFLTCASIGEGCNYLLAASEAMRQQLAQRLGARFHAGIGTTDRLWLRKEIMQVLAG